MVYLAIEDTTVLEVMARLPQCTVGSSWVTGARTARVLVTIEDMDLDQALQAAADVGFTARAA